MKPFAVRYAENRTFFIDHPEAFETRPISICPWGGDYRPETTVRVGWDGKSCLFVHLKTHENNPKIVATRRGGDVWLDSCMEFFFSPSADLSNGYFNFEMNANPTLLDHYGPCKKDEAPRVEVEWPIADYQLESRRYAREDVNVWELYLTIPFAMVKKYAPEFDPQPGTIIRANAYKCGDETAQPHFICCFPIDPEKVPEPAFHKPEFFGELELMK